MLLMKKKTHKQYSVDCMCLSCSKWEINQLSNTCHIVLSLSLLFVPTCCLCGCLWILLFGCTKVCDKNAKLNVNPCTSLVTVFSCYFPIFRLYGLWCSHYCIIFRISVQSVEGAEMHGLVWGWNILIPQRENIFDVLHQFFVQNVFSKTREKPSSTPEFGDLLQADFNIWEGFPYCRCKQT